MSYSFNRNLIAFSGPVDTAKKNVESEANAIYSRAILQLQSSPDALRALGPTASFMVDIGKQAIDPYMPAIEEQLKAKGKELLSDVANMAISELKKLFPGVESTVNDVVSTISQAAPGINLIMSGISIMKGQLDAQEAEIQKLSEGRCRESRSIMITPTGPSGESGIGYKATDIFSVGGGPLLDVGFTNDGNKELNLYPMSAFGRAFVGIFETLPNPDPKRVSCWNDNALYCAIEWDHPQYHNDATYKRLVQWYKKYLDPNKLEQNVGVPYERRQLLKSIRMAMAARSPASDSLFPVYLDLIADCMKRGWVTGGFMDFILSHYVTLPYETNRFTDCKTFQSRSEWDGQSWAVVPDKEQSCKYQALARGAHPGSLCGEGGWKVYVDSIIKMVNDRPDPSVVGNEVKKARMLLGFASGAFKKNFEKHKQSQKAALIAVSRKAGLLNAFKKGDAKERGLTLRKIDRRVYWIMGAIGVGALAYLGYSRRKKP